jgi:coenzyme F420 hydrogenase subunit beta
MTSKLTPGQRLFAIVEQGLCIGCGLCQSVAGEDRVRVTKTSSGYLHPVIEGELDHDTVDRIYEVCPGTRIEGLPQRLVEPDTRHDNVWGPWRRMVRAWAGDPEIRFEGSTGGVLTALGQYLLTSGRVEFILQVKTSAAEPSFGDPTLSFTEADVFEAAGSRYGPAAALTDIGAALDRGQPFAFIAKPCDVSALRNYARQDDRVDQLVRYMLVMVCRGRGCPGPTRVETGDEAQEFHYIDYWGEDETTWSLPFRCKICPDGIGEAADIAAADTWIGGGPNRVDSVDDPGTNALIARTRAGEELIAAAAEAGALTLEYDIPPDTMSLYQPHQVNKKYAVWARHQGLRDAGRIVPHTERLRIEELAQDLPEETNAFQRNGTRRRIEIGKATEPTPEASKS